MTDLLCRPRVRAARDEALVQRVRRELRSPRRHQRTLVALLGAVVLGAMTVRVLLGDYLVTPRDFFAILSGAQIPGATYIVWESKLPRALLGLLVGVALGVSGALFQTTLRNPLASPDILGIGMGASAAVVTATVVFDVRSAALGLAAVAGALLAAFVIRFFAGTGDANRLVVAGIGVTASLQAVIQYLFTRADEWDAHTVLRWVTGSVGQADWPTVRAVALALAVLLMACAALSRSLAAVALGPDTAAGLGVPRSRPELLLLLGVLLCAVAVAAAGPLAFVALLAGPASRALNRGRPTLVGAGLVGALIVVLADHVATYAFGDTNLPAGVLTGAVGAPFLLFLLCFGARTKEAG